MPSFTQTPSGLWTPQRTVHVRDNYFRAYQNAPEHSRKLGAQFYPNWRSDAEYIGSRINNTPEHASAMIAHLSPTTEAEMNRMMALQISSLGEDKTKIMHEAADYSEQAIKEKSERKKASLKEEAAKLRKNAGLAGTPLNLQSNTNISKALKVRDSRSSNPFESLGDVKIGDFGRTIADPYRRWQVIDTHFHDAGVNRTDIPYDTSRGLSAVSRYKGFQNAADLAYMKAIAHEIIPHDTPANAFMGGIWYAHQQRKVMENPSARQARRASESRIANFLASSPSSPEAGSWNPEHHGLVPSLSHIRT